MTNHEETTAADGFRYGKETKANALLFQEVCERVFERMRHKATTEDKLGLLHPFLSRVAGESSFPLMRLILPELDNLRDKYGMKTAKLAKLIAAMYFSDKDRRYTQLVLHTDPVRNPSPEKDWQITGDFPLTLQYVLENAPNLEVIDKTTWTLGQVNEALDDLARATNDAKRAEVLRRIRVNCSPMNQKWIAKIILKNLKIKVKKDKVLQTFHPDALDEYSRTTSLKKVCTTFIGRSSSIRSAISVEVFMSFSPMLATNFYYNTDKIVPSLQGRPFCMDVKLDGERMLCHRDGDQIKWFTRNAKDYSDKYGPVLDRYILAGVDAKKCILDGEVVTWDDEAGRMFPFGHNRTYAKEEAEGAGSGTRWLFYVVFDIVYVAGSGAQDEQRVVDIIREAASNSRTRCDPRTAVKGGSLTAFPLDVRRRVLRSILTEEKHRLEFVKSKDVESGNEGERKKQLAEYFEQQAIQLGEEGLVVKDYNGQYKIGGNSRKFQLWVKMKPEYSDQTTDMDLIILAASFAHGQMRSGFLSKFLLGVAVPTTDDSPPTKFYPITRVGTGFTLEQLEELNNRLKSKWKYFDDALPEHFDSVGLANKAAGRDGVKLTHWIAPEDSICFEIKSMQIVKTSDWPGLNCTLRFPRITRIRYDKGAEGCLDTTQLAELQARPRQSTSAASGGGEKGGGDEGHVKRRRGARRRSKGRDGGRHVSELFAMGGGEGVSVKQNVFATQGKELEMCVIGAEFARAPLELDTGIDVDSWWGASVGSKRKAGTDVLSRKEMGDLIKENGGILTAHPEASTAYVVVGKSNAQVKAYIKTGQYNVVDCRWVFECIHRKQYNFPPMRYLRSVSPEVWESLSLTKDQYGDDYIEPSDVEGLSQLLLNMNEPSRGHDDAELSWLSPLQELDFEDRDTLLESPDLIFADSSRCLVYCDLFEDLGLPHSPTAANPQGKPAPSIREEIPFSALSSTAAAVRLYGGDVAHSLHTGVTHVVMDPLDATRLVAIRARMSELHRRPGNPFVIRLVKQEWVWRCIELGRLEPPTEDHCIALADFRDGE